MKIDYMIADLVMRQESSTTYYIKALTRQGKVWLAQDTSKRNDNDEVKIITGGLRPVSLMATCVNTGLTIKDENGNINFQAAAYKKRLRALMNIVDLSLMSAKALDRLDTKISPV